VVVSGLADDPRGRQRHRPGAANGRRPGLTPVRSRGRAPATTRGGGDSRRARAFMTASSGAASRSPPSSARPPACGSSRPRC
jgi:hypothetical protein